MSLGKPCEINPDAWFDAEAPNGQLRKEAAWVAAVCTSCPIQAACRELGRKNREPYGVWGGEATADRAKALGVKVKELRPGAAEQGERQCGAVNPETGDQCIKATKGRGKYCAAHEARLRTYGDVLAHIPIRSSTAGEHTAQALADEMIAERLTVPQMAKRHGVSKQTIRRWMKGADLTEPCELCGTRIRYNPLTVRPGGGSRSGLLCPKCRWEYLGDDPGRHLCKEEM
jgi:hypothetical protein